MDNSSLRQRLATSALLVSAETICASGRLPERDEMALRFVIAEARSAFAGDIPERGSVVQIGDHDPEYRRTIEAVTREMGA